MKTIILLFCSFSIVIAQEIKQLVVSHQVDMKCSITNCVGFMRPTTTVLTSYPPQYPHNCNVCKTNFGVYFVTYPYISYDTTNFSKLK